MALFTRTKVDFGTLFKKYFSFKNETKSLEPLYEIFHSVKRYPFSSVLAFFKENPDITNNFSTYLTNLFKDKPFNLSLTEANILSENAFLPELRKRALDIVLPPVGNENSVWFLVDYIFVRPGSDFRYMREVPQEQLDELFRLLRMDSIILSRSVKRELLFSANILAWRAVGNALDNGVMNMVPEYRNYDNPFLALQDEMDLLKVEFGKNPDFHFTSKDPQYKQIKIYLEQCLVFIETAFKNSSRYGITGKINQSLLKIKQQIVRVSEILALWVMDSPEDVLRNSKKLVMNVLEYKSHKNNISELFNDSTRLKSHLITNHTAETGAHYITSTFKEYSVMFWNASGGGVIVGALCVLKMLYSFAPGSEFSHAFMYAFNYAMGFIMIYLMGFTLATKQPAMTAATMAKVLSEDHNTQKNYRDFAHIVSRLFRTQFIAFMGNVLWAFPVALLLIYGIDVLFNNNFASEKSTVLLSDLDPIKSKALLHASIAGFYLFLSGIISGNVGNNSVYYQIPARIAKNPIIKTVLGERAAKSLSRYYSRNWAGIVSNFWFGVFLGVTGPIGTFLGVDLDIRHITFAAGNFALGLYGKDFDVDAYTFWISFVTVFLIGFFNFLISFGLSMFLAMRSRKLTTGGIKEILRAIWKYFLSNPMRFVIPIRSGELDQRSKVIMEKASTRPEDH